MAGLGPSSLEFDQTASPATIRQMEGTGRESGAWRTHLGQKWSQEGSQREPRLGMAAARVASRLWTPQDDGDCDLRSNMERRVRGLGLNNPEVLQLRKEGIEGMDSIGGKQGRRLRRRLEEGGSSDM
jgi:hypothetical protein